MGERFVEEHRRLGSGPCICPGREREEHDNANVGFEDAGVGARPWLEGFGWKPGADIYRDNGTPVVQAELPELDPAKDLEVDVEENVLQIKGEKSESKVVKETDLYVTERRYGSLRRSAMHPDGMDPAVVSAACDNGILTVRVLLPKASTEQ